MTPAERLQPYITAEHRRALGLVPLPDAPADPNAWRDDPDLMAYATVEIARLRKHGTRHVLAENDHESKIRCEALERMIRVHEGVA